MNKHRKSGIRIIKLGLTFLALTILLYQISIPSLKPYESYFLNPSSKVIKGNHLTATFLGTSSILLNDGETSIMTDGFITRPNIANLLLGRIKPDKNLITDVLKKTDVTNLSALITLHSHHDHAMDAPEVAMQTGALLVGSESSANIGRGWGLSEEKIRVVKSGEPLQFGKFKVTLIRSKHSSAPRLIHNLTGVEEEIIEPLNFPAPLTAFKEGGSY